MFSRFCLPLVLLIGLLSLGCGASSTVNARGRIIKGGQPFVTAEGEGLRIIFAPETPPAGTQYDSYAAEFHREDGTFVVKGKDGKGLPPGKYRVSLELMKNKEDRFKGQLQGPKSPLTCEVSGSGSDLVLDLDQAKVDELLRASGFGRLAGAIRMRRAAPGSANCGSRRFPRVERPRAAEKPAAGSFNPGGGELPCPRSLRAVRMHLRLATTRRQPQRQRHLPATVGVGLDMPVGH